MQGTLSTVVEDPDDVGMAELDNGLGLPREPRGKGLIHIHLGIEEPDHDQLGRGLLDPLKDGRHPIPTNETGHPIAMDGSSE
jgi:hypothetical protein